ncbi:MAG TPA: alpha/beta hydrolase family protein [Pyrinomonadaceae bacterium]|jgi:S-formylglutathione hydrolase FrmB|nr:alpha/beta hydrolase family protein [Pyrinomonadaceae bacterium]
MKKISRISLPILLSLVVFASAFGQTASKAEAGSTRSANDVVTLQLPSKLLGRSVSYRVITPAKYKTDLSGRYPVIYLLHGLFGHFDNWTDKTKLAEYAAPYNFIIVTPEGGDGWYTDSATVPNDKYESYIVQELIPEVEKRFRTIADRDHRFMAGLSMGGYGAIKYGLKYPDLFSLVGSFSGALDAPLRLEDNKNLRPSIVSVFGPDDSKTRKENDIFNLLRNMSPDVVKNIPYIYMACGTEDFLFQTNRDFDNLLIEKKVPHEYRELPGAHEWTFWDAQVQEFLRVADSKMLASRR